MADSVVHPALLVPRSEVEARLMRLQRRLAALELPAAAVTHRVDLYYLTGSMPNGVLVCPPSGSPTFLVRKSLSRTQAESPLTDLRPMRGLDDWLARVRELTGDKPARVGIDLDVLPATTYLQLVQKAPQVQWVDIGPVVRELRAVKSAWEAARLDEAAKQVEAGYAAVRERLAEGMSEIEISVIIESAMRRAGHSALVRLRRPGLELVPTHVSTGVSAAAPTAFDGPVGAEGLHPASAGGGGRGVMRRGVPVMLDILGVSAGYTADIARTFCLGEPPDEIKRAHDFCREALHRVADLLRPGGRLFLREGHPVLWTLSASRPDGLLVLERPYFEREQPNAVTHEWNHGLGEIVTAVLNAGMELTMLEEHDSAPWEALPGQMEDVGGGEWRLSDRPGRLPHTYTLQARRPPHQDP